MKRTPRLRWSIVGSLSVRRVAQQFIGLAVEPYSRIRRARVIGMAAGSGVPGLSLIS